LISGVTQRCKWFTTALTFAQVAVVVVLPYPFRGMGGTLRRPNSRATPQGLD